MAFEREPVNPEHAGSGTRTPVDATRYVQTRLGTLSYAELAPHLAREVQALEQSIESGHSMPALWTTHWSTNCTGASVAR